MPVGGSGLLLDGRAGECRDSFQRWSPDPDYPVSRLERDLVLQQVVERGCASLHDFQAHYVGGGVGDDEEAGQIHQHLEPIPLPGREVRGQG